MARSSRMHYVLILAVLLLAASASADMQTLESDLDSTFGAAPVAPMCTTPLQDVAADVKQTTATCKVAAGAECCFDKSSLDYGSCTSSANKCPDGGKFSCNGGNCPKTMTCSYVASGKQFGWGATTCDAACVAEGGVAGMFCWQNGASDQFKACCNSPFGTTAPTTPKPVTNVDCVGAWSTPTTCLGPNGATCGTGGTSSLIYKVTTPAAGSGKRCSATHDDMRNNACSLPACPTTPKPVPSVDCVGSWSAPSTCGPIVPTFSSYKAQHKGCFADKDTGMVAATLGHADPVRDLTDCLAMGEASKMTPDLCHSMAAAKGYKYFGIQYAQECFAWNSYGKYGPSTACTMKCKGNAPGETYTCGGPWANEVFAVDPEDTGVASTTVVAKDVPVPAVSCGGGAGQTTSIFTIKTLAAGAGKACPAKSGEIKTAPCAMPACPVDCAGTWSAWGTCASSSGATCGSAAGTQSQTFTQVTPASNGGAACPTSPKKQSCVLPACNQACVGSWGTFSSCAGTNGVTCGAAGSQVQTYSITTAATGTGTKCVATQGEQKSQTCTLPACPVACVGQFGTPTICKASATCGVQGTQSSTYSISQAAANTGTACPYASGFVQESTCQMPACTASDCDGTWSGWSTCAGPNGATCGSGGQQSQSFTTTTQPLHGGKACPTSPNTQSCVLPACPVNCVGSWGSWSTCAGPQGATCGSGGSRSQTFGTSVVAANGGASCIATDGQANIQQCDLPVCPVNCVGAFGTPTACAALLSCGVSGSSSATYSVSTAAVGSGAACPYAHGFVQTSTCQMPACAPQDCAGSWSAWSTCSSPSARCGPAADATQTQTFTMTTPALYNGNPCPASPKSQSCALPACPVACVGTWGAWSTCMGPNSATCGAGGMQTQTFSITQLAANGGAACLAVNGQVGTQSCDLPVCPVNCVGAWSTPSTCLGPNGATCGASGTQLLVYQVTTPAVGTGSRCSATNGDMRMPSCTLPACPVNCQGAWGAFSPCAGPNSATCGAGGTSTAVYSVSQASLNGGLACPAADGQTNTQQCNLAVCPVDCEGAFGTATACAASASCGVSGSSSATYSVSTSAVGSGAACPFAHGFVQTSTCQMPACAPRDCAGTWSGWSTCSSPSATCGPASDATQTDSFTVTSAAMYNGKACPTSPVTQPCTLPACPVDCAGAWSTWTACASPSVTCGTPADAAQTQTFSVSRVAAYGGAACLAVDGAVNKQSCSLPACPVACVGAWGAPTTCLGSNGATCGTAGLQMQVFGITVVAANGGASCEAANGQQQTSSCSLPACPVACVGTWGAFSTCAGPGGATCGAGGSQTQTYTIAQAALNGGATCASTNGQVNTQQCNLPVCPVNCVGAFGSPTTCAASATCGVSGSSSSTYAVSTPAVGTGSACPHAQGFVQTSTCQMPACVPQDCAGTWSAWSTCAGPNGATCGSGGQQSQSFAMTTPALHNGKACPTSPVTQSCVLPVCPVACVGAWGAWSTCATANGASCGPNGGQQTQKYSVTTPAAGTGAACVAADGQQSSRQCVLAACPVACVGAWGAPSTCQTASGATCGGPASIKQTYVISVPAANNGAACEANHGAVKSSPCTLSACVTPSNCVGSWGALSTCTAVPPPFTSYAAAHIGCFADRDVGMVAAKLGNADPDRDLRDCLAIGADSAMTPAKCHTLAAAAGYKYFSVQYGRECFAGNTYGRYGPATNCNKPCVGNKAGETYTCGGSWANDVFAVRSNHKSKPTLGVPPAHKLAAKRHTTCGAAGTQSQVFTVTKPALNGGASCPAANGQVQSQACAMPACKHNHDGHDEDDSFIRAAKRAARKVRESLAREQQAAADILAKLKLADQQGQTAVATEQGAAASVKAAQTAAEKARAARAQARKLLDDAEAAKKEAENWEATAKANEKAGQDCLNAATLKAKKDREAKDASNQKATDATTQSGSAKKDAEERDKEANKNRDAAEVAIVSGKGSLTSAQGDLAAAKAALAKLKQQADATAARNDEAAQAANTAAKASTAAASSAAQADAKAATSKTAAAAALVASQAADGKCTQAKSAVAAGQAALEAAQRAADAARLAQQKADSTAKDAADKAKAADKDGQAASKIYDDAKKAVEQAGANLGSQRNTVTSDKQFVDYHSHHKGCFKDAGVGAQMIGGPPSTQPQPKRDLLVQLASGPNSGMTVAKCHELAAKAGLKFFAVQYAQECWGGNTFGAYGPASNCNMPCKGNKAGETFTCGGGWANDVFSVSNNNKDDWKLNLKGNRDCEAAGYGGWGACTGCTGTQTASLIVKAAATGNGKACPAAIKSQPCQDQSKCNAPLPNGTYKATCVDARMEGNTLKANCLYSASSRRAAERDMKGKDCWPGACVSNFHGYLDCVRC